LRRDDRHSRRDPRGGAGRHGPRGQSPEERAPHGGSGRGRRLEARVWPRARRVSAPIAAARQVLGAGGTRGQRLRGPEPLLQLRAGGGVGERYNSARMRILLSNDDGYFAPGLAVLAESLAPLGDITVVAPERDRSGASNSLTLDRPLQLSHAHNGFYYVN